MSNDQIKDIRNIMNFGLTPALLGIVVFFLVRLISSIDDMNKTISEAIIDIRLMQDRIQRHEQRIFDVESKIYKHTEEDLRNE